MTTQKKSKRDATAKSAASEQKANDKFKYDQLVECLRYAREDGPDTYPDDDDPDMYPEYDFNE